VLAKQNEVCIVNFSCSGVPKNYRTESGTPRCRKHPDAPNHLNDLGVQNG